jgi:excisionase family DNA binding protein
MTTDAAPLVDRLGQYATVPEVAAVLRADTGTVYRHIRAGRLPAVRFGGSIRVPISALEQFLVPVGSEDEADPAGGES